MSTTQPDEDVFCEEAVLLLQQTANKLTALSAIAREKQTEETDPRQQNSWYRLSLVCKGLASQQERNIRLLNKDPLLLPPSKRSVPLLLDVVKP